MCGSVWLCCHCQIIERVYDCTFYQCAHAPLFCVYSFLAVCVYLNVTGLVLVHGIRPQFGFLLRPQSAIKRSHSAESDSCSISTSVRTISLPPLFMLTSIK